MGADESCCHQDPTRKVLKSSGRRALVGKVFKSSLGTGIKTHGCSVEIHGRNDCAK